MLRVRRAPAVAEHQHLAPRAARARDRRRRRGDGFQIQRSHLLMQRNRRVERLFDDARGRARFSHAAAQPFRARSFAASMFATNSSSETCSGE
jgi:hypothetical protein